MREFPNLKRLNLSGCPRVLDDLDWLKEGKGTLEGLNLSDVGLTEQVLEQMIEEGEWFRNLQGLNIRWNAITTLPSNILKLTKLENHRVSGSILLSGGPIYPHSLRHGLVTSRIKWTDEAKQLSDKIFCFLSEVPKAPWR